MVLKARLEEARVHLGEDGFEEGPDEERRLLGDDLEDELLHEQRHERALGVVRNCHGGSFSPTEAGARGVWGEGDSQ